MERTGMPQPALFHERIEEAIDEVIRACGGRKAIAAELWPDKPLRDAHNLLDACLNPDRRERLQPSQLLYVARRGREVGCHALMAFICAEAGYADPKPIEPEDERARLQREFVNAMGELKKLAAALERSGGTTNLKAVG